jgi:uncharacterized protein (TIGR00106 family)
MKVIVDLCVVPIGVGVHLAPYIATCEKVLTEAGLKIQLHPNGTAIEGEWQPVFQAIEACHQAVHAMGCPRIYTTVKSIRAPTRTRPWKTRWPACRPSSDASPRETSGAGSGLLVRAEPAASVVRQGRGL